MTYTITEEVLHVAGNILCTNDHSLEEQINKLLKLYEDGVEDDFIDYMHSVEICDSMTNTYTVKEFIELLPWPNEEKLAKEALIEKYVKKLKAANSENKGDPEFAHIDADNALIDLLNELGLEKVADAYNEIDKWFA